MALDVIQSGRPAANTSFKALNCRKARAGNTPLRLSESASEENPSCLLKLESNNRELSCKRAQSIDAPALSTAGGKLSIMPLLTR